jgi:predicted nucleic acid-binding protein
MILVDTNVLIDVFADDPQWADWSMQQLDRLAAIEVLAINPVVYAELSARFESPDALDSVLKEAGVEVLDMDRRSLFLAGRAHQIYRRRGGTRSGVLSDFFIGAQAAVRDMPLLTRDAARYRAYFSSVRLITPEV